MENLIIQLSRYVIILLFIIYTLYGFTMFRGGKGRVRRLCRYQEALLYLIHFICHMILFLEGGGLRVAALYGAEVAFFALSGMAYRAIYKNMSGLIFNHMRMFLAISFVMLLRLDYGLAVRQFVMAAAGLAVCLFVPFAIDRLPDLDRLGLAYGALGAALLLLVFVPGLGVSRNGASNWILVGGVSLQPSEFAKILFVFFIAALLSRCVSFRDVAKVSLGAAAYVLILVAERDLGAALLFFVTYLAVLYVATEQPLYMAAGLAAGGGAAFLAGRLFSHVRVRVSAWRDPFRDIEGGGYQLANSLFAIGTGGWFGMGLGKGLPTGIPLSESDFIFPAISEELGGIFAFCLVMAYLSCYLMFVNIAMKMRRRFYKLTAVGLSTMFIFQVLLNVGGVTQLIPSTGVTLPLISYGGSSLLSTILLFGIIQGMHALSQEGEGRGRKERRRKTEG